MIDVAFLYKNKKLLTNVSNDIISYNAEHGIVKTRTQIEKATSSCRMWQLILIILDNLDTYLINNGKKRVIETIVNNYASAEYYLLIDIISKIIDKIKFASDNTTSTLKTIIYDNTSVVGAIKNYRDSVSTQLNYGKNYLCVYAEGIPRSIYHFFTIIRTGENEYHLNSSYGSDFVCVNQYTTPLDIGEFDEFINAVTPISIEEVGPDEYEQIMMEKNNIIIKFFQKFFLVDNIGKYYGKDDYSEDPKLKFAFIHPDEGNLKEVGIVINNEYRSNIRCGNIVVYEPYIKKIIETVNPENKIIKGLKFVPKIKPRGGSGTKRRKTRRNKSKRTTKRTRSSRSSKRCSR